MAVKPIYGVGLDAGSRRTRLAISVLETGGLRFIGYGAADSTGPPSPPPIARPAEIVPGGAIKGALADMLVATDEDICRTRRMADPVLDTHFEDSRFAYR